MVAMVRLLFLIVSFVAVRYSTISTNSRLTEIGLWVSWVGLLIFILNAKFLWFNISPNAKFIPAFTLIGLHLYNRMYCQCEQKSCCEAKN